MDERVHSISERNDPNKQGDQPEDDLSIVDPSGEMPKPHAHNHEPEHSTRRSVDKRFAVDLLMLAVVIIAALVYWGQLKEMQRANDLTQQALNKAVRDSVQSAKDSQAALKISRETAAAAKLSADAAKRALDLTKRSLEARLALREVKIGPAPTLAVGSKAEIQVSVENTGKLTAERIRIASNVYLRSPRDPIIPTPLPPSTNPWSAGDIAPGIPFGITITRSTPFTQEELGAIVSEESILVFVAVLTYSDIFTANDRCVNNVLSQTRKDSAE